MNLAAVYALLYSALLGTAPNVVLLSVDTLRADFLGCYGCPYPTSPHVDRLAAESLVFDDAVCEVPLTAPSMSSMLASRYPRMIGMTRNGLRLPAGIQTVAQEFQNAGYFTFCVQSNWTLKTKLSHIDRGFDVYDDHFHQKRWGILKGERSADEV
ncbi:MAG TPA: sulfatase-like hydrolase/transferase, partial [Candidatus Hydrogenedentes bacterium]|nr:sulfatase-like hydrolase/transferase [Candidatus Hydrogenedentota bacterium]